MKLLKLGRGVNINRRKEKTNNSTTGKLKEARASIYNPFSKKP